MRDTEGLRGYKGYKLMALSALLLMLLPALAGCSAEAAEEPPPPATQPVTVEYWTPFSGGDNIFMTELVEQFNREHEDIRIDQINSRLDDYYSRLRTAILSGNAPDLAIIHTTNLPQFVQNGYIESLDGLAADTGLDWGQFNAKIAGSTVYGGAHYAVPLDTHTLVLYYNKKYLREAGLLDAEDKPLIGKGEEGFKAFLQQLRTAVPAGVAPLALPSTRIDSVWLWWSLYNQMQGGGSFYNPEGTQAVFNNKASQQTLEFVNSLYQDELIPPDINDAFKLFYDGEAATLITGVWGTGAFEKDEKLELGVVPVPVIYDHPAVWGDSHTLAIPAKSEMSAEKRKAAMVFARWAVEHGVMWAEAGHVPSSLKVVESEAYTALKFRSDYANTANSVAYWPRNVRQWSINEEIIRQFERMIYKEQSPEQALQRAVDSINLQLKK
ncbi:ABC transporter substrate-binding protein [Paenibacillus sp. MMS20-IR301]|uniref:ABC transporter substrate-binding protein n=1 Tax=Paenibacillus sp. MMS20-IR301 TaxID=2895946 RepID=UPI0028E2FEB6|nr:ABC transporter substrate-binding protein [Paenibacillus sp. MMS20-IR301]WNS46241.1 ABC transporter substrate-binding protein [Paenibacillus sp. MMS20-IR301]